LPVYAQVIEVKERIRPLQKTENHPNAILASNGQTYIVDTPLDMKDIKQKL
jgi:hypothetical protein